MRLDAWLTFVARPFNALIEGLRPAFSRMRSGRLAPPLFSALETVGLGTVVAKPDEKNNWRARVLWEEAERRGIAMREFRPFGASREIFFATKGADTRCFEGVPRPRYSRNVAIHWMDDKGVILKKFGAAGIPVPRGAACRTIAEAETVFASIGQPVIVKPSLGSRSRHTYVHIADLQSLRSAFRKAKELSPCVVVEEELSGFVFRITLVGGRVAGVMRREPPHVIGDGKHTVGELAIEENKDPLRQGPIFHELHLGAEAVADLDRQGLTLESIPEQGRMVTLHEKVSRTYGASMTEVTDIHPENLALFIRMGEVLDDPLVGIDFMIDDLSRPWKEQKCGIIECNSLPFIDLHHFPLKGPARNVAGMVWDIAFREAPGR